MVWRGRKDGWKYRRIIRNPGKKSGFIVEGGLHSLSTWESCSPSETQSALLTSHPLVWSRDWLISCKSLHNLHKCASYYYYFHSFSTNPHSFCTLPILLKLQPTVCPVLIRSKVYTNSAQIAPLYRHFIALFLFILTLFHNSSPHLLYLQYKFPSLYLLCWTCSPMTTPISPSLHLCSDKLLCFHFLSSLSYRFLI